MLTFLEGIVSKKKLAGAYNHGSSLLFLNLELEVLLHMTFRYPQIKSYQIPLTIKNTLRDHTCCVTLTSLSRSNSSLDTSKNLPPLFVL